MSYKPKQYYLNIHFTLYEHLLNLRIKMLMRISVLDLPLYIIIVRQRATDNVF